jgi:ABC-type Fe3+/spermidine/putrescine transport system ATPase subunit
MQRYDHPGSFHDETKVESGNDLDQEVLSVHGLCLSLGSEQVLSNVSFRVGQGELVAVIGPSGSGKSTLLNVIAGFLRPSAGDVQILRSVVSSPKLSVPPEKRGIGMVFQSHALLPQLRVWQNVAFPLERRGMHKKESYAKAVYTLRTMGMEGFAERLPDELSGGQQQRVGLARALTADASLYLLDEPTANLDAKNREAFAQEVRRKQQQSGIACVYVTHHIEEAFEIADRVLVLINGSIQQIGTPEEIYERPNSLEVAGLVGKFFTIDVTVNRDGEMFIGETRVPMQLEWPSNGFALPQRTEVTADRGASGDMGPTAVASGARISGGLRQFELAGDESISSGGRGQGGSNREVMSDERAQNASALGTGLEGVVLVLCRPEWCAIQPHGVAGTVELVRYQGVMTEYELITPVGQVVVREFGRPRYQAGQRLFWLPSRGVVVASTP